MRGKMFRRLLFFLIASILSYILITYEPVNLPALAFAPSSTKEESYSRRPVYEYDSLYRKKADISFEQRLEAQLVRLEEEVRGRGEGGLAEKRIWQVTTPELAGVWESWRNQWRDNSEGWEYRLYTSAPTDLLPLFESVPEIREANERFKGIREDLMRYLILWYHGGFWTAIDTWERMAMRDCSPIVQVVEGGRNVSLMIGVDDDEPYLSPASLRQWGWTRGFGFGQAVLWAPRRFDPILRKAIVRTISHAIVEESLPKGSWSHRQLSKIGGKFDTSGELSGAGMFTDIVLETLSRNLPRDHALRDKDAGLERRVSWKKLKHLMEVLWLEEEEQDNNMSGVAILPINVWGSGQDHSRSGPSEGEDVCVNHVHGWRPEKHKIFGG